VAPQQPQQPGRTAGPYGTDSTGATGAIGATGGNDEFAAADGRGEVRAAERSAERAAALAVTEGFHPLRVRPYVAGEADDTLGGTTVRPLIDADPDGSGGPTATDLGLFPAAYAAIEGAQEHPQEYPVEVATPDGTHDRAAAHGRHRRRRRSIVVAAAAVAASALAAGAVAVTGQVMGPEQGGTDRAQPDRSSAVPEVTLPTDAAPGAVTQPVQVTHYPMRATTSPAPNFAPSTSATPSTTGSASASTTPPSASATATPSQTNPSNGTPSAPATSTVLQLGDNGPEVTDLQQQLTQVWIYHGSADGRYDSGVEKAVAMFQVWYGVQGDPSGVYGASTRAALDQATASGDSRHPH
jgi:hypothetical protein